MNKMNRLSRLVCIYILGLLSVYRGVPLLQVSLTCGVTINPLRLIAGTIGKLRICNHIIPVKPRRFEAPFRQEFCLIEKVW